MLHKKVSFNCGPFELEGILCLPGGHGPFGLVVICHPHPLYGGNMDNNVVDAVARGVLHRGLGWFKFNFRGVGKSLGSFSGGVGEQEDLKAAITFAQSNPQVDSARIGVCGYSFGSQIAFAVSVKDNRVKAVAGISPFVEPEDLLSKYTKPKLFVCGTEDELVDITKMKRILLNSAEPKELLLLPGVNHFWQGKEGMIVEKVGDFFARLL